MTHKVSLVAALLVVSASHLQAAPVAWQRDWRTANALAASQNKPILLLITASWCGPCHRMLEHSFPDPQVAARVNSQFVPLVIDADQQVDLVRQLRVDAMPTLIVMNRLGQTLIRHTGYLPASELNSLLASSAPSHITIVRLGSRPPINPYLHVQPRRLLLTSTPSAAAKFGYTLPKSRTVALKMGSEIPVPQQIDTLAAARQFGREHEAASAEDHATDQNRTR